MSRSGPRHHLQHALASSCHTLEEKLSFCLLLTKVRMHPDIGKLQVSLSGPLSRALSLFLLSLLSLSVYDGRVFSTSLLPPPFPFENRDLQNQRKGTILADFQGDKRTTAV